MDADGSDEEVLTAVGRILKRWRRVQPRTEHDGSRHFSHLLPG